MLSSDSKQARTVSVLVSVVLLWPQCQWTGVLRKYLFLELVSDCCPGVRGKCVEVALGLCRQRALLWNVIAVWWQLSLFGQCIVWRWNMWKLRTVCNGGWGVTGAIGSVPGAWKTDFTCLIIDGHLAAQPLPGCNYGPCSHSTAMPTRIT